MEREQVFQNIIRQIGNGHQEDYENLIDLYFSLFHHITRNHS